MAKILRFSSLALFLTDPTLVLSLFSTLALVTIQNVFFRFPTLGFYSALGFPLLPSLANIQPLVYYPARACIQQVIVVAGFFDRFYGAVLSLRPSAWH